MAPPVPCIADIQDEMLEEIFLRLPTSADLARASTACPSFRRVIAGHVFLRRYRALYPPPLIGMVSRDLFIPAQPPHPSAAVARAFAGFDFSCYSFLPRTAGRTWSPLNFLDGRALLAGAPVKDKSGIFSRYRQFLARDLAVCDPVHRRYILLPPAPSDLKALLRQPDLLGLETFHAPSEDEEDPLSFRVICLAQCRMNLLLLVFSSSNGQWRPFTYDQWSAQATFASIENSEPGLSHRQYVGRCFCWRLHFGNKLLLLDTRTMEFSAVNLPTEEPHARNFVIVEAAEGTLGMLTTCYDAEREDNRHWLIHSILRNNQWQSEKVILFPVERVCMVVVGAAGQYLLIEAFYTTSSQEELKFGYFSVDVKTLQVELFAQLRKPIIPGRVYAGFPPSLCAPTI